MSLSPEQLDVPQLRQLQLERLQALIAAVEETNSFWMQKLTATGVDSDDIQSLDDIRRLPICTKQELVEDQNRLANNSGFRWILLPPPAGPTVFLALPT